MNVPRALRIVLWPLSLVYGAVARLRAWMYVNGWLKQERLKGIVISVGNMTVGGTGKTPMVIWLADKFLAEGKSVAVLSRGYRGSSGTSDDRGSSGTSDEIELMKRRLCGRVLFGVGKNRLAEGRRLEANGVDIFLLDDGFQHLPLARDVDIVLVDSTRPLHEEFVLPAGRLREPHAAIERAHMVVFCGIGNPEAFWGDLERWGLKVVGRKAFRDHHLYTQREVQALEKEAELAGAAALVTTEKDAQNLDVKSLPGMPVHIAVIALEIPDEARFLRDLQERLRPRRGVAA